MAAEHLTVEEADRDLTTFGVHLLVDRQLDHLHGRKRDPGDLGVLQPTRVVNFQDEVGLVQIQILGGPFQSLIVEEADSNHLSDPQTITRGAVKACAWATYGSS